MVSAGRSHHHLGPEVVPPGGHPRGRWSGSMTQTVSGLMESQAQFTSTGPIQPRVLGSSSDRPPDLCIFTIFLSPHSLLLLHSYSIPPLRIELSLYFSVPLPLCLLSTPPPSPSTTSFDLLHVLQSSARAPGRRCPALRTYHRPALATLAFLSHYGHRRNEPNNKLRDGVRSNTGRGGPLGLGGSLIWALG